MVNRLTVVKRFSYEENCPDMPAYDVDLIRSKFPAITRTNGQVPPVFLDNPGGTQVPCQVIDAITDCLINKNANVGGPFQTSVKVDGVVAGAHQAMADFVNAKSEREIIIGQNMTTLTFHLSRSIGRLFSPGDEIIVTRMDHDANVSPWLLMARDNDLTVKYLGFDKDTYEFDLDELDGLLSERTKLVCFGHASNLTGTINDVRAVVTRAKSTGALVFVDSVQYAPHGIIDVQDLGCDFLVCSPYKFFGPHMGVLWGREEVLQQLDPYKVRPATNDLPGCFETGTMNHEGMAGITATVDYFAWIGETMAQGLYQQRHDKGSHRRQMVCAAMDCLVDYELPLMRQLIDGLGAIKGVKVHGITNPNAFAKRVPTVSFTAAGHDPSHIATQLGDQGIQVWNGHNYAVEPVNYLGLMQSGGVVRIGLAHYNTKEEVDQTLASVDQILHV